MNIERFEDLLPYLRQGGHIAPFEEPNFTILRGGVSNRTVLVEVPGRCAFVLKQALERLRVESEWHSDPRRIEREALGLEWLARLAPLGTITPLLFLDKEHHILSMAAVPHPHTNWKTDLLQGIIKREHVEQFAGLLAVIHTRSVEQRDEIAPLFSDRSFFETLRLEPYYRFTADRVPEAAWFLNELIRETESQRLALVHGDYSPKNVLVHKDHLVLLDHEVIHFGDPAFDLGFSLTHFLSKAHHLPEYRAVFLQMAALYWQTYQHEAAALTRMKDFENRVVWHTLACLLARVEGRSPLEYLTAEEKRKQRTIVLELISCGGTRVIDLAESFGKLLV